MNDLKLTKHFFQKNMFRVVGVGGALTLFLSVPFTSSVNFSRVSVSCKQLVAYSEFVHEFVGQSPPHTRGHAKVFHTKGRLDTEMF